MHEAMSICKLVSIFEIGIGFIWTDLKQLEVFYSYPG